MEPRPNTSSSPSALPTYGYHNTYHTHAQLPIGPPPCYARALEAKVRQDLDQRTHDERQAARSACPPPSYSCSVEMEGIVGVKQELASPFHVSAHREWTDVYAVLRGTQLSLYRIKNPTLFSRSQKPSRGKLLRTYSLQHSEVGVASDFKKTALIAKSPFAHLVPAAARPKLYETDPHLFEPVREHAVRLRLELEQFLMCPASEAVMLDWIEALTAAVDISPPLEDRSEPRYRSLPRRNRRQRVLEGASLGEGLEQLSHLEAGRRIIAQQEQIIRTLYPHLAAPTRPATRSAAPAAENDLDDFDPEDVRFPTPSGPDALPSTSPPHDHHADPALAKSTPRLRPSRSQNLRYRRRCAPILLASSPRVSDIVFTHGQRVRINIKDATLVEYTPLPPRYDAHNFPRANATRPSTRRPRLAEKTAHPVPRRPGEPIRGPSHDSITSISCGDDALPPGRAHGNADEDVDLASSRAPSPTGPIRIKADAAPQLEKAIGKSEVSGQSRDAGLSAVLC